MAFFHYLGKLIVLLLDFQTMEIRSSEEVAEFYDERMYNSVAAISFYILVLFNNYK